MSKVYTVLMTKSSPVKSAVSEYKQTGTIEELNKAFSYTLECGASYQREKGNSKINRNPKTIKSVITNLNNAVNNSAANGYSNKYYTLVE